MVGTYSVVAISGSCGMVLGATLYGLYLCRKAHSKNIYETQKSIDEYMHFHYGNFESGSHGNWYKEHTLDDGFNFPVRCVILCAKYCSESDSTEPRRALDIGCAVGRSTFELSRHFDKVIGIDYSKAFISQCNAMKEKKQINFAIATEGDLSEKFSAQLDPELDLGKVSFRVGDACNLPKDLGKFHCVLAANLICRLYDPYLFLERLPDLLVVGGILVLSAPYTWLSSFTPKARWLGGYLNEKDPVRAIDTLKEVLSPHFALIKQTDMPMLIRETERKHQWTMCHITIWRRLPLET